MRCVAAVSVALVAAAICVGPFCAAQEGVDMRMVDAGFVMRPADTPQKLERLRLLPARQFIGRTRNGKHYFLFADPDLCKCVFVGNQAALQAYHNMTALPQQPDNVPPSGVAPYAEMVRDTDGDTSDLIGDDEFLAVPY
jgi:hypothetical protein